MKTMVVFTVVTYNNGNVQTEYQSIVLNVSLDTIGAAMNKTGYVIINNKYLVYPHMIVGCYVITEGD